MFAWIHSEYVADELPAPPEDMLTDGADVSPVSPRFFFFDSLVDLHNPSQTFIQKYFQSCRISFSHMPSFTSK